MMDEPVPGHWLCPVRARLGASDFGRGVAKGRWCGEQGGGGRGGLSGFLGRVGARRSSAAVSAQESHQVAL